MPAQTPSPSVVVIGSLNMDLIGRTATFPRPGETVLGSTFVTAPGGKGANQAVAAARAGATVEMIGAVGDDAFAGELREHLAAVGVDVTGVRTMDGPTGVAMITVDDAAENTIVVLPGANGRITDLGPDDRDTVSAAAALLAQLEIPPGTVVAAAELAHRAGVPVILNPSPVVDVPDELWALVSVVVVNESEAGAYADHLTGIDWCITTLGAAGCDVRGPDGSSTHVDAFTVEAVDTTGAGDAFAGTLAAAWAAGLAPLDAVHRACAAGALATTVPGAGGAAPTAAAVDRLLAGR